MHIGSAVPSRGRVPDRVGKCNVSVMLEPFIGCGKALPTRRFKNFAHMRPTYILPAKGRKKEKKKKGAPTGASGVMSDPEPLREVKVLDMDFSPFSAGRAGAGAPKAKNSLKKEAKKDTSLFHRVRGSRPPRGPRKRKQKRKTCYRFGGNYVGTFEGGRPRRAHQTSWGVPSHPTFFTKDRDHGQRPLRDASPLHAGVKPKGRESGLGSGGTGQLSSGAGGQQHQGKPDADFEAPYSGYNGDQRPPSPAAKSSAATASKVQGARAWTAIARWVVDSITRGQRSNPGGTCEWWTRVQPAPIFQEDRTPGTCLLQDSADIHSPEISGRGHDARGRAGHPSLPATAGPASAPNRARTRPNSSKAGADNPRNRNCQGIGCSGKTQKMGF